MNEEKHILSKLETTYFGKKENEKLTIHEIGVILEYVSLLEQNNKYKNEEIERLNNIINDIKEYVNFLVIFNQTINGKFSETQWGQDILDLIGSDKE